MGNETGRDRDLVLAPGEYAYVLDTTKGLVNTIVGPNKISMSNTDQPVVWDKNAKPRPRFVRTDADKAIQLNSVAPEGFYIALYNPAEKQPTTGSQVVSVQLQVGHRVNIPGPVDLALWPGQMAEVIRGHHLRSNQYVLAQVYNDQAASENWGRAVLKPQADGETKELATPTHFTPGQLLIIKGTDVAFFIPPTGIKVVPENDGNYIREAVTLERLEYCILLDENGNKRFVQGPDVVFPKPTETFVLKDGQRKFRAIELNETSGIYVKVIADYKENGQDFKAGDELFITGKEQAIYYQREEHSVIRYGDKTKHYAVAVPAGEGRYVLNRNTGEITLRRGPLMLLCDPRHEVIVRRVLSTNTARLWYPGNEKVVEINQQLAARQETVAEAASYEAGRPTSTAVNSMTALYAADEQAMLRSSKQVAGDVFNRGNKFTPPRTLTLDTKYEGAVGVSVWTGYAVQVINKRGSRRVVIGPENVLLEYDETLAPLELSTGQPKNDTKLFKTVYLRVSNNKVSDIIDIETQDLVQVRLGVSYRVNFEGEDHEKWFAVENYIKLMSDHLRSKIRNVAKRTGIETFYGNTADLIRDAVLGKATEAGGRPGCVFTENGMRVYDVEVLSVTIQTPEIAALLHGAQKKALNDTVNVVQAERQLEIQKRLEYVNRLTASLKADTVEAVANQQQRETKANLSTQIAKIEAEAMASAKKLDQKLKEEELGFTLAEKAVATQKVKDQARVEALRAEINLTIDQLAAETEQMVKRAGAVNKDVADAITAFADKNLVKEIATSLAPVAAVHGISAVEVLGRLFEGTPMKSVLDALAARTQLPVAREITTR